MVTFDVPIEPIEAIEPLLGPGDHVSVPVVPVLVCFLRADRSVRMWGVPATDGDDVHCLEVQRGDLSNSVGDAVPVRPVRDERLACLWGHVEVDGEPHDDVDALLYRLHDLFVTYTTESS